MSLKLYFLRHGETVQSKEGGYCGELDPKLTSVGQQMAQPLEKFGGTETDTANFPQFASAYRDLP